LLEEVVLILKFSVTTIPWRCCYGGPLVYFDWSERLSLANGGMVRALL